MTFKQMIIIIAISINLASIKFMSAMDKDNPQDIIAAAVKLSLISRTEQINKQNKEFDEIIQQTNVIARKRQQELESPAGQRIREAWFAYLESQQKQREKEKAEHDRKLREDEERTEQEVLKTAEESSKKFTEQQKILVKK